MNYIIVFGGLAVAGFVVVFLWGYVLASIETDLPWRGLDPFPYVMARLFRVPGAYRFDRDAALSRRAERIQNEERPRPLTPRQVGARDQGKGVAG